MHDKNTRGEESKKAEEIFEQWLFSKMNDSHQITDPGTSENIKIITQKTYPGISYSNFRKSRAEKSKRCQKPYKWDENVGKYCKCWKKKPTILEFCIQWNNPSRVKNKDFLRTKKKKRERERGFVAGAPALKNIKRRSWERSKMTEARKSDLRKERKRFREGIIEGKTESFTFLSHNWSNG